jgi:hypothetical protein
MPNDLIDVRDGHLLFRISRDRTTIQIKLGRSRDQLYEVDLRATHPIVCRATVRPTIANAYDAIGLDNTNRHAKIET